MKAQTTYWQECIYRNDTLLQSIDKKPYTGISLFSNIEGSFVNGIKEGKFNYYAAQRAYLDSTVEYLNGKRNGVSIKYFPFINRYSSLYTYVNNVREGVSYSWHKSGQLEKITTYKNGKIVSTKDIPINKSISNISFIIEGEENGIVSLSKLKDTIKLYPSKEYLKLVNSTPTKTISKLENYSIKSFSFSATFEGFCRVFYIKGNTLSDEIKKYFFNNVGLDIFYIDNLIIIDQYGAEYYIHTRRFELKK